MHQLGEGFLIEDLAGLPRVRLDGGGIDLAVDRPPTLSTLSGAPPITTSAAAAPKRGPPSAGPVGGINDAKPPTEAALALR